MKRVKYVVIVFAALFCSCTSSSQKKLVIAGASNTQYVLKELIATFENNTGIECETVISSSGKITAQIMEGAPFDIFLSADMKYPEELFKANLTMNEPEVYAYGGLVLWTMKEGIKPGIMELTGDLYQSIAIANPKTAPYGVAALQSLRHFYIYESVNEKLIYGESISQTNQFITTEAAQAGFTAKSVVMSPGVANLGNWTEVDPASYSPIAQGVVILKTGYNMTDDSQLFHDFLFSKEAKLILNKFGYSTTEK
jgi:molybdate transport system substrate-binding protein